MRRRWRYVSAALLLVVLAACGGDVGDEDGGSPPPSPLADCADLVADEQPGQPLPALTLPCFTDGEAVALDRLRGPAVVNLWASWCEPCRRELPVMQRLAERADGQLQVIGVVVSDRPAAAAAIAEELGITFPAVVDQQDAVRPRIGARGMPATAFIDGAGDLRHVHDLPLDDAELARLVGEHLAVTVG